MRRTIAIVLGIMLASAAAARDTAPAPALSDADRPVLAQIVLDTWAEHVESEQRERWLQHVEERSQSVPLAWLESAAAALDLRSVELALDGLAPLDAPEPLAFGDVGGNLVYTPLPPCRLLDTRQPSPRGGTIKAQDERNFYGYDINFQTAQGGNNSNCGLPVGTRPEALAITLVAVVPAGDGFLTAYAVGGSRPLASALNYMAGAVVSTAMILPINNSAAVEDFTIYSYRETHVVADVVGFFSRPEATPLSCVTQFGPDVPLSAGSNALIQSPLCPTGYGAHFGGCFTGNANAQLVSAGTTSLNRTSCWFRNTGSTTIQIRANTECCRIPGR